MSRIFAIASIAAILMAGAGLFQLKYQVAQKAAFVKNLKLELNRDREAIRVLRAEWSHLNRPDYLQDLSIRYLALRPPLDSQIKTSPAAIPFRPEGAGPVSAPNDLVIPVPRRKPESRPGDEAVKREASGV